MKKYLLVSPVPPPFHGQTYAVKLLLEQFPQEGVEIVHLDTRFGSDLTGLQKASWRKIYLLLRYLFQLLLLRFRHRFDGVILTPSFYGIPFLKDSIFAWAARLFFFRRIIGWLHMDFRSLDYESLGSLRKAYVRQTLRLFDHFVCVAPKLVERMPDFLAREKISVVLNGVPPFPDSERTRGNDGRLRAVYYSDFSPAKGWDVCLEAARRVVQEVEGIEFLFFGRLSGDSSKAEIDSAFEEAGDPKRIRFGGEMELGKKPETLRAADVFCFPSLNEACPLTVIESMAAGLPIIASDVGGVADLLVDGDGGKLVKAGSADELTEALLEFVRKDARERKAMGEFNLRRFEEIFTDEAYGRRWAEFLRGLP
ncbi:MAG: glycosyltransferase family 4 protein [Verrucomicrobiota bacterium]